MASKDPKTPTKGGKVTSESNEEEPTALYDQPLIVEGKRKRRSVDLFAFSSPREAQKTPKETQYKGGDGAKLGDIAIIQYNITKTKADDLKLLYKICFESSISVTSMVIKKGLRSFNGWSFTEDSDEFQKRVSQLERLTIPILNTLLEILSLDKHGNKADMIARILTFLSKPVDNGIPIPEPKKRRKSSIEKGGGPTKKSKVDEDEGAGPDTEKENKGEKEEENEDKDESKIESEDKDESKMETENEEAPSAATGTDPVTNEQDTVSKDDEKEKEKEKKDEENGGESKEDGGETKDESKQDTDTPTEGEQNNVSNDNPIEKLSPPSDTNNKLTNEEKEQSMGGDKPVTTSTEE